MLAGVEQVAKLTDDLLDLGRVGAGTDLESKPCHLGVILVEAVDEVRARAAGNGVTLALEPAEKVAIVAGDAATLRRAVTNLLDSAIRHARSGSVVRVGLSVRSGDAVIRVADIGVGIASVDHARPLERYSRGRRRDARRVPVNGLGLAITRTTAERHGGSVWVESHHGKGRTFHLSFPLKGKDSL